MHVTMLSSGGAMCSLPVMPPCSYPATLILDNCFAKGALLTVSFSISTSTLRLAATTKVRFVLSLVDFVNF